MGGQFGEHEGVHDLGPFSAQVSLVPASCCGSVANERGAALNGEVAVIAFADSLEHGRKGATCDAQVRWSLDVLFVAVRVWWGCSVLALVHMCIIVLLAVVVLVSPKMSCT